MIERAAILAEGGESTAIFEWITAHAGAPESALPVAPARGLYGGGFGGGVTAPRGPARYVLPEARWRLSAEARPHLPDARPVVLLLDRRTSREHGTGGGVDRFRGGEKEHGMPAPARWPS